MPLPWWPWKKEEYKMCARHNNKCNQSTLECSVYKFLPLRLSSVCCVCAQLCHIVTFGFLFPCDFSFFFLLVVGGRRQNWKRVFSFFSSGGVLLLFALLLFLFFFDTIRVLFRCFCCLNVRRRVAIGCGFVISRASLNYTLPNRTVQQSDCV